MNSQKLKEDLIEISNRVVLPEYVIQILPRLAEGNMTKREIEQCCFESKTYYTIAKVDFLHFIFEYIRLSLEDNVLTSEEKEVILYFKEVMDILPGDFLLHTNQQVRSVLEYQFSRIYDDNYINSDEVLLKNDLQALFDLDFKEINHYSQSEAITSLKLGAKVEDLDVQFTHKEYFNLKNIL
jgi:hypothetical protein